MIPTNNTVETNPFSIIPDKLSAVVNGDRCLRQRLDSLIHHAQVVQTWQEKLQLQFPFLSQVKGKFETTLEKMGWNSYEVNGSLTEAEFTVIQQTEGGAQKLFWFRYAYKDYPTLGISKGITIREHRDPTQYDWLDFVQPDKWQQPFDPHDPQFEQVTAMTLAGSISRLTEHNQSHMEVILQSFANQVGLEY